MYISAALHNYYYVVFSAELKNSVSLHEEKAETHLPKQNDSGEQYMKIIDTHCHFIPYVDDGADSLQESIEIIRESARQGVEAMIATPHYRKGMFEASAEKIRKQFAHVCRIVREKGINVCLYLGCEYYANEEMAEELLSGRHFTMANSSYVLVEFGKQVEKEYAERKIKELVSYGYRPITAHIERYQNMVGDMDFVRKMVESGAFVQINAGSILGAGGFSRKQTCKRLIQENLIHFIGSDAHGIKRRQQNLGLCREYMQDTYGYEYTNKIMSENPEKIIKEYIGWYNT